MYPRRGGPLRSERRRISLRPQVRDQGELVCLFEKSDTLDRIYIPSDDPEGCYRALCGEFREVNAAGGLVVNRRGDYLLIRRDGLWDLPKGHQEPGEDISVVCTQRSSGRNRRG